MLPEGHEDLAPTERPSIDRNGVDHRYFEAAVIHAVAVDRAGSRLQPIGWARRIGRVIHCYHSLNWANIGENSRRDAVFLPLAAAWQPRNEFRDLGTLWPALVAGAKRLLYAHGPETPVYADPRKEPVAQAAESGPG